jgi:hypothetical protein
MRRELAIGTYLAGLFRALKSLVIGGARALCREALNMGQDIRRNREEANRDEDQVYSDRLSGIVGAETRGQTKGWRVKRKKESVTPPKKALE